MKLPVYTIATGLALFFTIVLFTNCKSIKRHSPQDLTATVLLKKQQDATYIKGNYEKFNPSDIKKSNRTLNQYRVKFTCSKTKKNQLLKKLKKDAEIIEFKINSKTNTNIQSGSNKKHSKVSPIKKINIIT